MGFSHNEPDQCEAIPLTQVRVKSTRSDLLVTHRLLEARSGNPPSTETQHHAHSFEPSAVVGSCPKMIMTASVLSLKASSHRNRLLSKAGMPHRITNRPEVECRSMKRNGAIGRTWPMIRQRHCFPIWPVHASKQHWGQATVASWQPTDFYTQKLLHTEAFTHRGFYTQTPLHTDAFTYRPFYTQTLLHTEAFTHRSFYTQTLLHTETGPVKSQFYFNLFNVHFVRKGRDGQSKIAIFPQFLTSNVHFVRKGCPWHLKIAILHQFLTSNVHFVWKGCEGYFKIAILLQFLTSNVHFVRNGCDGLTKIAILPQFLTSNVHFVRKGRDGHLKIAILLQFLTSNVHFVWKGCVSWRSGGTAPALRER